LNQKTRPVNIKIISIFPPTNAKASNQVYFYRVVVKTSSDNTKLKNPITSGIPYSLILYPFPFILSLP